MTNLEDFREYYEHDAECTPDELGPINRLGLRKCKGCAGVFMADGKTGLALTSKRFDSDHIWRKE